MIRMTRKALLSGAGALGLSTVIADRRAHGARPAAPPAVWPPRAQHQATTRTQFMLIDKAVRFLPNAPAKELKPGQTFPPPVEKYPDNQINMHNDGFHIAFIDNDKEPYWKPDKIKPRDIPASWLAPVDFLGGTIHYRIDVAEKPNDTTLTSVISRICTEIHEGTHNVWLGHGVCTFDRKGVHHFSQPVKAFRPFIRDTKFRWDKPLYELQLVVADSRGAVVHKTVEQAHNAFEGSPDIRAYLPLKVRYSALVVAQGAHFQPPAWW